MKVTLRQNITPKSALTITLSAGVKGEAKFFEVESKTTPGLTKTFIEVTFAEGTEVSPGQVLENDLVIKTSHMTAFFKPPSMKTLEKYSFDGVSKSVTGKICEPDGHSDDGAPSWLLALGMI